MNVRFSLSQQRASAGSTDVLRSSNSNSFSTKSWYNHLAFLRILCFAIPDESETPLRKGKYGNGKTLHVLFACSRFRVEPFVNLRLSRFLPRGGLERSAASIFSLRTTTSSVSIVRGVMHSLLLDNLAEIGIVSVEFIIAIPPSP
jgi:hypothetical protein